MTKNNTKANIKTALFALCAASFVLVACQIYFYMSAVRETSRSLEKLMSIEAARAVEEIAVHLRKVERSVISMAADLDAGRLSEKDLESKLDDVKNADPYIVTVGVSRNGDEEDILKDYKPHGPGWTDAFRLRSRGEALVVAFGAPYSGGRVYATVPLETLRNISSTFKFGDTGYGYILSRKGAFLYYPIRDVVENRRTIFKILPKQSTPEESKRVLDTTRKAISGEPVEHDVTNPTTHQRLRLLYRPIADTGWTLGAVFSMDEMSYDGGFLRRQKMWTVLWLVIFITILTAVIVRVYELEQWKLWTVAAVFSLLSIVGSAFIWYLTLSTPLIEEKDKFIFSDMITLKRFVDGNSRLVKRTHKEPPAYIPTGIYIQSLKFDGSNDLYVTGYVWQKYSDGAHDKLSRGFIMPEARELTVREAYRNKEGNVEVIGWYFQATIRQMFDYSKYPFDRPNIWIWLRPADFTDNVILIPDLGAYKFLAPTSMPGLQEEVAPPGYTFLGTFFDREYHIRRSTFGLNTPGRLERTPELFYNIVVKRNFLTPCVTMLFPIFIMLAILFVVQLMFSQDEEKKKAYGFSALAVMGVVITFFFSTLLSHNNLRQQLGADNIIFIENFHFIAYTVLLLVSIKTLIFIGGKSSKFIQYRNGLIPKVLYWPFCAGLIFIISFIRFY